MKELVFTEDLITGIAEIDNQHREIFNWGNVVLFPKEGELTDKLFMDGILFLSRYSNYHFLAEEQAMMDFGYTQLENHKLQHRMFRDQIGQIHKKIHGNGVTKGLVAELHFLLSDWLVYHIKVRDRDFAKIVKEEGDPLSAVTLPTLEILRQKLIEEHDLKDIDDITVSYSK